MAKKDKKSKTAEQKARVAAKQNKKAAQKEKKVKSKGADDSDADDIDLESVLEEYAKQVQKRFHTSGTSNLILLHRHVRLWLHIESCYSSTRSLFRD